MSVVIAIQHYVLAVFAKTPNLDSLSISIAILIAASVIYFIGRGIAWIIDGFANDSN